jgi:hypothetical protein
VQFKNIVMAAEAFIFIQASIAIITTYNLFKQNKLSFVYSAGVVPRDRMHKGLAPGLTPA